MCIAIFQPEGAVLTKKVFRTCWENNPDGFGMLWINKGKLNSFKELKSTKTAWKEYYSTAMKFPRSPFVLHFRIGTHGKIDLPNCHPFFVNEKLAFVHNGIISVEHKSADLSDTNIFNETILKLLPEGFLSNTAICDLIEDRTKSSKLVFMDNTGTITIFNEKGGLWDNGFWYSNTTYKAERFTGFRSYGHHMYGEGYEKVYGNQGKHPHKPDFKQQFFAEDYPKDVWDTEEDAIITKQKLGDTFELVDNCVLCGQTKLLNNSWECKECSIENFSTIED